MTDECKNLMRLDEFVREMNNSNSTLDKIEILKKYAHDEYVKRALLYTYDPYRKYYVTPANVKKNDSTFTDHKGAGLFEILDMLNSRNVTGHAAIGMVNSFLVEHVGHGALVYAILDRNLKIRVDASQINKVIPDLIPTFDVALANEFEKKMVEPNKKGAKKVDFQKQKWLCSRKLDGCRCLCIIDEYGNVTFRSRRGLEFNTLGVLIKEVSRWGLRSVVFDGEICIMLPDGRDDFQGIMKQIRKKDHTIVSPKYHMFDMIPLADFNAKRCEITLSSRLENLRETISKVSADPKYFNVLAQGVVQSEEHLDKLSEYASKCGWEGLILRLDAPYVGKRSNDMLKVKDMQDAEYEVVAVERDDITSTFYRNMLDGADVELVDGEWRGVADGSHVSDELVQSYSDTRLMVSKIVIMHKGNAVGVGSGLSMAQRREWHEDDSKIIGKTVTIQYFQETEVDGRMSLRFPVLKWKYDDERDV